jgi:hypothetical protein
MVSESHTPFSFLRDLEGFDIFSMSLSLSMGHGGRGSSVPSPTISPTGTTMGSPTTSPTAVPSVLPSAIPLTGTPISPTSLSPQISSSVPASASPVAGNATVAMFTLNPTVASTIGQGATLATDDGRNANVSSGPSVGQTSMIVVLALAAAAVVGALTVRQLYKKKGSHAQSSLSDVSGSQLQI